MNFIKPILTQILQAHCKSGGILRDLLQRTWFCTLDRFEILAYLLLVDWDLKVTSEEL